MYYLQQQQQKKPPQNQKIVCKSFKQVLCKISSSSFWHYQSARIAIAGSLTPYEKNPLDYKGENRTTSEIPKEREADILSQVFQTI